MTCDKTNPTVCDRMQNVKLNNLINMSKRDFFRTIIKLFGLYSLILSLFQFFPSLIRLSYIGIDLWSVVAIIGLSAIIIAIYIFLISKPDLIIDWLKLDKGFDDDRIEFGAFDSDKLVSFATILIGGFLIVDYFPSFINNCYNAFKENVESNGFDGLMNSLSPRTQYFDWAIATMNIVIGFLLLSNYQNIAKWVTKTNEKNNS